MVAASPASRSPRRAVSPAQPRASGSAPDGIVVDENGGPQTPGRSTAGGAAPAFDLDLDISDEDEGEVTAEAPIAVQTVAEQSLVSELVPPRSRVPERESPARTARSAGRAPGVGQQPEKKRRRSLSPPTRPAAAAPSREHYPEYRDRRDVDERDRRERYEHSSGSGWRSRDASPHAGYDDHPPPRRSEHADHTSRSAHYEREPEHSRYERFEPLRGDPRDRDYREPGHTSREYPPAHAREVCGCALALHFNSICFTIHVLGHVAVGTPIISDPVSLALAFALRCLPQLVC